MNNKHAFWTMAFITVFLVFNISGCGQNSSHGIKDCPIIIAYIDDADSEYTLKVYDAGTGINHVVTSFHLQGLPSLAGYDKKTDCWYLEEDRITSRRIIKICGAEHALSEVKSPKALCPADSRVETSIIKGSLHVKLFDKKNRLISKRELHIPDKSIIDNSSLAWSPTNGYIAADLLLNKVSESQLCIFDRKSKLVANLGRGSAPQFVDNGRRLIYEDMSFTKEPNGEVRSSKYGTGNAVVYDISTGKKRMINIVNPPDIESNSVGDCIGSDDANWLICCYPKYPEARRSIYIVDIRDNGTKWNRLPISVYDDQWIILDTVPKTLYSKH